MSCEGSNYPLPWLIIFFSSWLLFWPVSFWLSSSWLASASPFLEWDCPFGHEGKSPAAAGVCRRNKKARENSPSRKSGADFRREFLRLRDQRFRSKNFSFHELHNLCRSPPLYGTESYCGTLEKVCKEKNALNEKNF